MKSCVSTPGLPSRSPSRQKRDGHIGHGLGSDESMIQPNKTKIVRTSSKLQSVGLVLGSWLSIAIPIRR
jgi:hypothetical protein